MKNNIYCVIDEGNILFFLAKEPRFSLKEKKYILNPRG